MAGSSDVEKTLCVVWNTERPFQDSPKKSSNFSFLGFEWYLQLIINGRRGNVYSIYLSRGTTTTQLLKMYFRVTTFVEVQGEFLGHSKNVEGTNEIIWDFTPEVVCKNIPLFQTYGKWEVACLFHGISPSELQTDNETVHVSTQTYLDVPPDLESLSLDVSNLLKDEVFPDVKLRCGGRTISAHRSILAGRSQVFAAMFRNKMVESETGIVDVTDLDVSILEMLLKYAYSGKITGLSDEITSSLYEAADKYAINALKNKCSDWMIRNLTEDNCLGFLTVADVHGDAAFKDAVFSFINCHPEVIYSDIWSRFSEEHPKLAIAAYRSYFLSTRK